jgi:hypothetical protein
MRYLAIVLLLPLLLGSALSQPQLPLGGRGPGSGLATRSVSAYLALERGLLEALKDGNRDAVLRMLDEQFAVSSPIKIDETSSADWLQQESDSSFTTSGVRNLNVREFDDVAVVNFLLDRRRVVKGKSVATTFYVIDVWRQSSHQLLTRYISMPRTTLPIPSRPTGRE